MMSGPMKNGSRIAPRSARQGDGEIPRGSTIADVAELAGVSTATVSRFLRGETVRRKEDIAQAIEKLGYTPNAAARNLRSSTTDAVAVIQHDITNPYLAEVVKGVQAVAHEYGYSLFLAEGIDEPAKAISGLASRVDGFIHASATDQDGSLEALTQSGKPAVLLEFEPREEEHGFDSVVLDDEGGSRKAIEYLIGLGHVNFGIIAGSIDSSVGRNRLAGATLALEEAGIEVPPEQIEISDFSWEGGYQATARLMGRAPAPTAIFAANNLMSLGSLHCLRDLGIRIPGDVSFISFDPLVSGRLFRPPPTYVDRPQSEQGALAMRLLVGRMLGRVEGPVRKIVMETDLVAGSSCGPPPGFLSPMESGE